MNFMYVTNRIIELVSLLNKYRDAYYNNNESLVSDKEYDMLFDELVKLEQEQGLILANSPTQTVGYEVVSQLKKVTHNHPLLSLGKTTEIQEFYDYFKGLPMLLMAKMDGLTCSLLYRDGKLVRAESRGDGETGEDITHNAKVIVNLPLEIPFKGEMIIDGECIITRHDFERINKPLVEKAEKEATAAGLTSKDFKEYVRKHSYANPRNLVSGSVRQLDSGVAAKRNIRFIGWKLHSMKNPDGTPYGVDKHTHGLIHLEKCGFEVVSNITMIDNSVSDYENAIESIKNDCEKLNYPIDGMVGMFDDIEYGNNLGRTGHHPRHSLAFKFYQEDVETTLRDIEWSPSRTGLINPVAIFDAIEIDGTTVSRATLNNVSIIEELKLGIGDTIGVIKANQIIPNVTKNLTESNTYQIPKTCPCCGSPTIIKADNERKMLYCSNAHCPAVMHDRIANFATRDAINIVGVSEKRLNILMELGFVTDFESLYKLKEHRAELINLRGFGESSTDALLKAIEESKNCKLQNVLVAIGMPGIGKSAAKTIANYCSKNTNGNVFDTFLQFAKSNHDWSALPEIGEGTSNGINQYVIDNIDQIEPLLHILNVEQPTKNDNGELAGKTFCITGKLVSFPNRDALVADIESKSGIVVSSVTAKTNYLITNDKTSGSSKNKAAEKHGTKIITEIEYINGNL